MSKKLIINAIEEREIRAAILDHGDPINFFVERSQRKYQKGNIYRARVTSIEPHLQAAFVELDKGQHGFLSASDVIVPDGGISLLKGEPEPPMPEGVKANIEKEKPKTKSGKFTDKTDKKARGAKEDGPQKDPATTEGGAEGDELFDDTPEVPVVQGPPPPKTVITERAGDLLLGVSEDLEAIVEKEWSEEELQDKVKVAESVGGVAQEVEAVESKSVEPDDAKKAQQETPASVQASDEEGRGPSSEEQPSESPEGKSEEPLVDDAEKRTEAESVRVAVEGSLGSGDGDKKEMSPKEEAPSDEEDDAVDTGIFGTDDEVDSLKALNDESSDENDPESDRKEGSVSAGAESKTDESTESELSEGNGSSEDDDDLDEDDIDDDIDEDEDDSDSDGGGAKNNDGRPKKNQKSNGNERRTRNGSKKHRRVYMRIEDVLQVGQYVTVQITKEGIGNKAPMVTTYISLAGHYMVLTPGGDRSGVSKQVRAPQERNRLRKFIDEAEIPERCGLIVRTAAEKIDDENLKRDIASLSKMWTALQEAYGQSHRSGLIKAEEGLITRLVREYYNKDFDEVCIDDASAFEEVKAFFETGMNDQVDRVKRYTGERPIFYHYKLEQPLQDLFRRRVNLPGGGSLIFDQAEAMLVIDVNSGTFKEGDDDEDTAFRLNMLACQEVAKQVMMRDVGGIIMIDFVDMRRISNRSKVEKELDRCFKGDKARINIMSIGALGVMQMSRQRTKDSLRNNLYSTCHHCEGTGLVPSHVHSAMSILREIRGNLSRFTGSIMKITTTPEMALELLNQYKSELVSMENQEQVQVVVEIDTKLGIGQYSLSGKGKKSSSSPSPTGGDGMGHDGGKKKRKRSRNKVAESKPSEESMTRKLGRLEKSHPPQEPLGVIPSAKKAEMAQVSGEGVGEGVGDDQGAGAQKSTSKEEGADSGWGRSRKSSENTLDDKVGSGAEAICSDDAPQESKEREPASGGDVSAEKEPRRSRPKAKSRGSNRSNSEGTSQRDSKKENAPTDHSEPPKLEGSTDLKDQVPPQTGPSETKE